MTKFHCTLTAKPEYALGEPVIVEFTLTNTTTAPQRLLKWNTPLDGRFDPETVVLRDGEPLAYDGPLFRYGDPTEENYLTVAPEASVTVAVDLSETYPIDRAGSYEVSYAGHLHDSLEADDKLMAAGRPRHLHQAEPLEAAPVTFVVAGDGAFRKTLGALQREQEIAGGAAPLRKGAAIGAAPMAPAFVGGSASQQSAAKDAYYEMFDYLAACVQDLAFQPKTSNTHYQMAFGLYDPSRYQTVQSVCTDVQSAVSNTAFTLNFNGPHCSSNTYAYTYKGSTTIYLCSLFNKASLSGEDSKIGTLFHELTHAVSYTDDITYGRGNCRKLAKSNPEKAIKNADNYEFFLESEFMYWTGNHKVEDQSGISPESNYNPAMVVYQDMIYLIYKGAHSNALYYTTYDGRVWSANKKISDVSSISPETNYTPGAVVYGGKIYLVYKGAHSNTLYYATFDGSTWSGDKKISSVSKIDPESNYNPGLCVYDNKIYAVYKGAHSNTLYYMTFDGSTWGGNKKISSASSIDPESNYNPGLCVYDNKIYAVYKGAHSNTLYYMTFDGSSWAGNHKISSVSDIDPESNYSPRAAVVGGARPVLYVPYKGAHSNTMYQTQMNYDSTLGKEVWTGNESVQKNSDIDPETNYEYSVVTLKGVNYAVYKGAHSNTLYMIWQIDAGV